MQLKALLTAALLGSSSVAAEVWRVNITDPAEIESIMSGELSKRQSDRWCAVWWKGWQYCTEEIVDAWCGIGDSGCVVLAGEAKSVSWYPNSSGKTVHYFTNQNCRLCCGGQEGPDRTGCQSFPANVAQSGVQSFYVS